MNRSSSGSAVTCQSDSLAALHAQAFPMLAPGMIQRAASYGEEISVPPGSVLLQSGDREAAFHIVLDGYVEVLEINGDGVLRSLLMHRSGEFTGSLDLFTDRPNAVTVRTESVVRLLRVSRSALAQMMLDERPLAEILLRAFILRRIGYLRHRPYAESARVLADRPEGLPAAGEDAALDLAVIGGGPAGLAAAAYAASEGLDTLLIGGSLCARPAPTLAESLGQPGLVSGLCEGRLLRRAEDQSRRFGSRVLGGRLVRRFDADSYPYRVWLDDGQVIEARTLIVATGMLPAVHDGAQPQPRIANTDWLDGVLDTDDHGFVLTGRAAAGSMQARAYETSQPGVFAVGAARAGSIKHVLASIAEGSAAVRVVHRFLDASAY